MKKTAAIILTVIFIAIGAACKGSIVSDLTESGTTAATNAAIPNVTIAEATIAVPDFPPALTEALHSRAVYVYDMNNNFCVYKKNEDEKLPPASILKIMTCLLVLEKVNDLSANVKTPQTVFAEFENGDPNTHNAADAGIQPEQDNLNYADVLHAMMLASGCEASNILAYNAGGGSIDVFVAMMNAKAKEIGCKNTRFTNAHGLYNPDNYTSAYDMFLITKYAYDNYPLFSEICAKTSYIMPANSKYPEGYKIGTANKLMRDKDDNPHYLDYATGIKSGSINEYFDDEGNYYDGFNTLVSLAEKDGLKYMTATLGSDYYDSEHKRAFFNYDDHIAIYGLLFG